MAGVSLAWESIVLALGARCVVAPGRNPTVLADMQRRFGHRVRTVELSGNEQDDRDRLIDAAPTPIDCVLDIPPPSAPIAAVRAAAMSVRRDGRIVLMGGVGMLGGDDLALPYPWIMRNGVTIHGQWMYPPEATRRLAALVHAGLLDLTLFEIIEFNLDDANHAVAHAANHAGPFRMTVIRR